jgi:hypothetical protein
MQVINIIDIIQIQVKNFFLQIEALLNESASLK